MVAMGLSNCNVSPEIPEQDRVSYFQKNGCLLIRGIIDESSLIQRLADEIDHHVANALSPRADIMKKDSEEGRYIMDFCNYHERPVYREVAKIVAPIVADLMESDTVRVYQDQIIVKEAGTHGWNTFWHTDQSYYDIEGSKTCSIWIPVDYVPRESSLEFLAGSHKDGPFKPKSVSSGGATDFDKADQEFKPIPPINGNRDNFDIRGWDANPGDALLHNLKCLHASPVGSADGRRVLSIRFIGDDVKVVKRQTRVPTSLANNANEGKEFPLVFTRRGSSS
mmetsp:Transcript_33164/g.94282  ORF Transcript_33164/g.94282 Transcript_33164/m.94282 type:complete len:280 (+) Transcript_33164:53-892(+)